MNRRKNRITIGIIIIILITALAFAIKSGNSKDEIVNISESINQDDIKKIDDKKEEITPEKNEEEKNSIDNSLDEEEIDKEETEKEEIPKTTEDLDLENDTKDKNTSEEKKQENKLSGNKKEENKGNTDTKKEDTSKKEEPKKEEPKKEESKPTENKKEENTEEKSVTITFSMTSLLNNMDKLKEGKEKYVPSSGYILSNVKAKIKDGENVFEVTKRVLSDNGIQFEYEYSPVFNSHYIEGINNIYEFDAGDNSGWVYEVNGSRVNVGSDAYKLNSGDKILWKYIVD